MKYLIQPVSIKHQKRRWQRKYNTGLNFANHNKEATAHYKAGYRLEHNSNTLNSAVKH